MTRPEGKLHPRVNLYAGRPSQAQVACELFLRRGFLPLPLDATGQGVCVLKLPKLGSSLAMQSAVHRNLEAFVPFR